MQKLSIKNFGPISELNINISNIMIFIGPQASGKSTVSKSIYLFKSLKDDLVKHVIEAVEKEDIKFSSQKATTEFKKMIRTKFVSFWGTTKHLTQFKIQYFYGGNKDIILQLKDGYVQAFFSRKFHDELNSICEDTLTFITKQKNINKSFASASEIFTIDSEKKNFYKKIEELSNRLFEDNRLSLYIPAGRSVLSTLSEPLQQLVLTRISGHIKDSNSSGNIDPYLLDYSLKAFIERISNSKSTFNQDFETIIKDKGKFTNEPIDNDNLKAAIIIFDKILKGRYRFDRDGEKIFLANSEEFVKLSFASSGQQEVIWILLQIFALILNRTKTYLIIEEPEAHLFPVAQKDIVELFCLFSNLSNNQLLITTHSPYILSSLNNFLYAGKLGKEQPIEVGKIINKKSWIKPEEVSAFYIENGILTDIIDRELMLIKAEEIDRASSLINEQFNNLFELDVL